MLCVPANGEFAASRVDTQATRYDNLRQLEDS